MSAKQYRPEIDGLRAISILLVLLYHARIPGFTGGFIGVDVFFVLSGYLITWLVRDELATTGKFDFTRFYARRVRRLLPTALVVIGGTLVLGTIFLHPNGEVQALAKSAIATLAFVSNLFFARAVDYFDFLGESKPLLHTWSLSVEEQFYLFWPATLWLLYYVSRGKTDKSRIVYATGALCVLSLIAAEAAMKMYYTREAFFYTPLRAWELLVGGLLALGIEERFGRSRLREFDSLGVTGLVVIVGVALAYTSDTRFPGVAAALPVLGTGAVLLNTAWRPQTRLYWLLTRAPLVALGRWSYALYMWHWPLLSIARIVRGPTLIGDMAILLLSLALSAVTVALVERPFRFSFRRNAPSGRVVAVGMVCSVLMVVLAGASGYDANRRRDAFDLKWRATFDPRPDERAECYRDPPAVLDVRATCMFNPADSGVLVVWGDSHAEMWLPMALAASRIDTPHYAVMQATMMDCHPFVALGEKIGLARQRRSCLRFNQTTLQNIRDLAAQTPVSVLLAARWNWFSDTVSASFEEVRMGDTPSRDGDTRALGRGLRATLDSLKAIGVRVLIPEPVPEMPYRAPECLLRWHRTLKECSVPRWVSDRRMAPVRRELASVVKEYPNVRMFDAEDFLCDATMCWAEVNSRIAYKDDDHLSATGVTGVLETLGGEERAWLSPWGRLPAVRTAEGGASVAAASARRSAR